MIDLKSINLKSLDVSMVKGMFKKKPERIGLHIGGGIARIVRLDRLPDDTMKLNGFVEVEFDLDNITKESSERFKAAIRNVGGGLQRIAVNIEDPSLRIRRMVFAKMPEADLMQAIKWNFREHIEIPIEKYVVGYTPVAEEIDGNKLAIVAYGVAEEAVHSIVDLFKSLGLKVLSVEPVATSILAAFNISNLLDDDNCHSCIVFGEEIANFIVMRHGEMLFSRPLAGINESSVVKQIVRDLNLSEADSKNLIVNWIVGEGKVDNVDEMGEGVFSKFEATMRHFYSQLVIEIQRSIDAFCILYGVQSIESLRISGLGVAYPGLIEHIEKTLAVKTSAFNPFENILVEGLEKQVGGSKMASFYSVAVGLAVPQ